MSRRVVVLALIVAGCASGGGQTGSTARDDGGGAPPPRDAGGMEDVPTPIADAGPIAIPDSGPPPVDAFHMEAPPDTGPVACGECTPAEVETAGSCGNCGMQQRMCGSSCAWGAFSCAGEGECAMGTTDRQTESCGSCGTGTRSRTRTCNGSCAWGGWGSWGACSGGGACAPGATRPCANGDSCGHEVCGASCTWGACQPVMECLRIRPGTTGPEGNNFRCCGTSQWQFCLSSCTWSTACATCSGCGC